MRNGLALGVMKWPRRGWRGRYDITTLATSLNVSPFVAARWLHSFGVRKGGLALRSCAFCGRAAECRAEALERGDLRPVCEL